MMAAQALGAIPVPLYQDAVAQEMVYVLQDAGITVAVVEDQENVEKMLDVREQRPPPAREVVDEPSRLPCYAAPWLRSFVKHEPIYRHTPQQQPGSVNQYVPARQTHTDQPHFL